MGETATTQDILLALSTSHTRAFRNNTGKLKNEYGRWVAFGLAPGSADVIGIHSVTITPEMVGKTIGVFVSIEVKKQGRDTTDRDRKKTQSDWQRMIRSLGGRAGIARSVAEAIAISNGDNESTILRTAGP